MASTLDPTEKSQPRKLFVERMRREGREKEWRDAVKATLESTGKTWGPGVSTLTPHQPG